MALLAEQLVDEWLNRKGFFTRQGIKRGVREIDLLGIRMTGARLEGWHVEVQVSFRPVSFIGKLSKAQQLEHGVKDANSSKKRSAALLEAGIDAWVEKKFKSPLKKQMRDQCWKNIDWQYKLVHGRVYEKSELAFIQARGVELIPFETALQDLCKHKPGEPSGGAGTDIAEIIHFYAEHAAKAADQR